MLVPTGRLRIEECRDTIDLTDKDSGGEIFLFVEQNFIISNVDDNEIEDLLAEPGIREAPEGEQDVS